jgi:hypothetical protein
MTAPQNNTPLELLDKQTQLLSSILAIQQNQHNTNRENNDFLAKWLTAILEEQRKQTHHLSNISTAATLFTVITVLSIAIGFCVGLTR